MAYQGIGYFGKFSLLMWKNFLLVWRHKIQTILDIILPIVFTCCLIPIRNAQLPLVYHSPFSYHPLNLTLNWTDRDTTYTNETIYPRNISFAPNTIFANQIMSYVKAALNLSKITAYETADLLNTDLLGEENRPLAGIIFDYDTEKSTVQHLHYRLRFPAELRSRYMEDTPMPHLLHSWQTNLLYPLFQESGPRKLFIDDGGSPPAYYRELFVSIQYAVSLAFIKINNLQNLEDPRIVLQRFPYPSTTIDQLLGGLKLIIPAIFCINQVFTTVTSVKMIANEKERKIRETLKILGLPSWLQWLAWFVKITIFNIITISITVIITTASNGGSYLAVFSRSHPTAIWFLLFSHSIANTTFIFLMSVLFRKASTAAWVTTLMWFIFSAPYFLIQQNYKSLNYHLKISANLFHNTGFYFGVYLILMHEANLEGLKWKNYFRSVAVDDQITVGLTCVLLFVTAIIYLLVALYVEKVFPGEFGVPAKWYFPVEKFVDLFFKIPETSEEVTNLTNTDAFEPEPKEMLAGIQIKGLKKDYNEKVVVSSLTLNLYEGEITALLGNEGSGKTTTMSMLSGALQPTSGTVLINGLLIRGSIGGRSIGYCPKHNMVFNDLTVSEHIYFFGKLNNLSNVEIRDETQRFLDLLDLRQKRNTLVRKLPPAIQRQISIGLACCGKSKVVLCEEPTIGLDSMNRKSIWKMLQQEKKGRTILLSTIFADEAEFVGDRVAIIHNGMLKCYGSPYYLKKTLGASYDLICEKGTSCDVNGITNLIKRFDGNTKTINVGADLSFKLEDSKVNKQLLSEIEMASVKFDIKSFGLSYAKLEDVFIKLTSNVELPFAHGSEENNAYSIQSKVEPLTPICLFWNQINAIFLKKTIYTLRNWFEILIQISIPTILTLLTAWISNAITFGDVLKPLPINLRSYQNNPIILLCDKTSSPNEIGSKFYHSYQSLFVAPRSPRVLQEVQFIPEHIMAMSTRELVTFNERNLIGASVGNKKIVAWFNNQPYHTIPLTLNVAFNALLKVHCPGCTLSLVNDPLPYTLACKSEMLKIGINSGFQLAVFIAIFLYFMAASYIGFYIKERVSRAKLLQFISGINVWTFWITAYIWDMSVFLATILISLAIMPNVHLEGWSLKLNSVIVLLFCFIWAVLPIIYVLSTFINDSNTGYFTMIAIGFCFGLIPFGFGYAINAVIPNHEYIMDGISWFFLWVPQFALLKGLTNWNQMSIFISKCDLICKGHLDCTKPTDLCGLKPQCCVLDYFAWANPGIGSHIIHLITVGILFLVILFMIEFKIFAKLFRDRNKDSLPDPEVHSNVREEMARIRRMTSEEIQSHDLVISNMTKFYKDFLAVNQFCLGVDRGECFVLLGSKGAGKTTTMKILIGDEIITSGEAWIQGKSVKLDLSTIYKNVGYFPQFVGLLPNLSGREILRMFCLLRGIPTSVVDQLSDKLSIEFDLVNYFDLRTKYYSEGNKRMIGAALAMIGNPSVVLLDEPLKGMDPKSKKRLYEILIKYTNSTKCIVLSSERMDECQELYTKSAIMVNGEMKCLGSIQHLKKEFAKEYQLIIQMKNRAENGAKAQEVKRHIEIQMTEADLKEDHLGRLTFSIPINNQKWSTMFGIMEAAKQSFEIESFVISQISLEDTAMTFTKSQRQEV